MECYLLAITVSHQASTSARGWLAFTLATTLLNFFRGGLFAFDFGVAMTRTRHLQSEARRAHCSPGRSRVNRFAGLLFDPSRDFW
jgi:hypothetical protein